jgi:hypothetical protein
LQDWQNCKFRQLNPRSNLPFANAADQLRRFDPGQFIASGKCVLSPVPSAGLLPWKSGGFQILLANEFRRSPRDFN